MFRTLTSSFSPLQHGRKDTLAAGRPLPTAAACSALLSHSVWSPPGQHLPPEVALAPLSTAMVESWTPQTHNLCVRFQGPASFILGLAALNNG